METFFFVHLFWGTIRAARCTKLRERAGPLGETMADLYTLPLLGAQAPINFGPKHYLF